LIWLYLRPNEKRPPELLLSAGSLPTSVNDETRDAPPAAMQTTRSTNAVMMAGCVSLPLAPRYHASILSSHSQHSPPCAEATISSMDALKSRYGSADSSDNATPPPNADDASSSTSPAWFVAPHLLRRATAGEDDGAGFFSRMELEVARGSKRRRSERSPRTMASAAVAAAAEASSDSVDGLSSACRVVVVVRADEFAKEDSAEESPRKMDAIVLAAADGARNDCVLGCLHEGHIHAAGGGGGGVSWAEFVVHKRELNAAGSPLAIGVGFDANSARRREVTRL
jgi:hypothetical protein